MEKTSAFSKEQVVKDLQALIQGYMDGSSKRSIASLSRDADVSESAIRRVVNQGALPNTENISKLVLAITPSQTNGELVENDAVSSIVSYALPFKTFDAIKDYTNLKASVEKSLDTSTKRLIFAKASLPSGISKEEIKEDFGRYGIDDANELVAQNLLVEADDAFKVVQAFQQHTLSMHLTKELLSSAIRSYYKPDTSTNFSLAVYDAVNVKGYGKIMDVYENAFKEIVNIVKAHPGDVPVFAGGFMDTMTTKDFFSKKGE